MLKYKIIFVWVSCTDNVLEYDKKYNTFITISIYIKMYKKYVIIESNTFL